MSLMGIVDHRSLGVVRQETGSFETLLGGFCEA
jgi:hypothetical protein